MYKVLLIMSMMLLAACSTPPKPPAVNGYHRQPINNKKIIERLALQAELAQTQEELREAKSAPPLKVSVQFPFNGTSFIPTPAEEAYLFTILRDARYIVIRGRTDGQHYTRGDERVALKRTLAAKAYLINHGISPAMISVNYLSGGDYAADNSTEAGRALNRRVDIEVYH